MFNKANRTNFLPRHPKIVKAVGTSLLDDTKNITNKSTISKASINNVDSSNQMAARIINNQRKLVQNLRNQLNALIQKNNVLYQSSNFYDNEGRKKQINMLIQMVKNQQKQVQLKIKNCEKVEQSTTPEQYYLWQKKKKMAEYDIRLRQILSENNSQRQQLTQMRSQLNQKIALAKDQIQFIIHEIELSQNQFVHENMSQQQGIDPHKMNVLKQQYHTTVSTIKMLRENNEILSSQFEEGLSSMQGSLRKSFQTSKSTLIRELQLIKKQIQSSQSSYKQRQRQKLTTTSKEVIQEYIARMKQIQQLLTKQQAQQAQRLVKPYDWINFRWQQYLQVGADKQKQKSKQVNYMDKYKALCQEYQAIDKEVVQVQGQIQNIINQNVRMTQQSLQIQSATNKLMKLLGPIKK